MRFIKAIYIIWSRDIVRTWRNKLKFITGLIFPFLWLVIFGSGIAGIFFQGGGLLIEGIDYKDFLLPGVLGMTILFTSIISAVSIVSDREFGFLKEVLVAPVPRMAVAIGKALGGSTIATIEGTLMLVLVPLIGVELSIQTMLLLVAAMFFGSFVLTSLGIAVSSRIKTTEGFQAVMEFGLIPMFLLSGTLFPATHLPTWMQIVMKVNPATYVVELLRQITFKGWGIPFEVYFPAFGVDLFGITVTPWVNVIIIGALGVAMILSAMILFNRTE